MHKHVKRAEKRLARLALTQTGKRSTCAYTYEKWRHLLKCLTYCFQNLSSLCPNISDEHCATVAPKRVLEYMGQLGLPVGDVVLLLVGQRSYDLLQEGERCVDVETLAMNVACGLGIERIVYGL